MTLNVTQGRRKWRNRLYDCLLVTTSILLYVRDITTFTVYKTACDLEKSFIFDTTFGVTDDVHFLIHMSHVCTVVQYAVLEANVGNAKSHTPPLENP